MDPQTILAYNTLASAYDEQTKGFWEMFPVTFLDAFAAASRGKVLNIGSGPGRDAVLLRERGLEVICLDAAAAMVNMTRDKGFVSYEGNLLELPFASDAFDGVWAYTSLLHVPKARMSDAVSEIRRVLKVKGTLGLGMIEGDLEKYHEDSYVTLPRLFSYYSEDEIEKLLTEHGFNITYHDRLIPKKFVYLNYLAQKK